MSQASPRASGATRTITLRQPIELRSKDGDKVVASIAELTMRRPTLGDLVAGMDAAGGAEARGTMLLHIAARACGVSPGDLAQLSLEDGSEVMEAIAGFMPAGLPTGTAGSTS
jgi:hypothetical protein